MFTDDDIRPPINWISGMCEPIIQRKAQAVAGGVRIANALIRPWMTHLHRSWLASTEWLAASGAQSLVGANMAFSRDVLNQVPRFDHELGPGAAGFGDDGLFASQLLAAGFKIHNSMNVCIEHHFEVSRLKRASWVCAAKQRGESLAYIGHHWEHWGCKLGRMRLLGAKARLAAWRARQTNLIEEDGCSEAELGLIFQLAMIRAHLKESKRERNYERLGLIKVRGDTHG